MDRHRKERKAIRSAVTRLVNEVDQELGKEEPSNLVLRARLNRLDQLSEDIQRLDRAVMDALLDQDVDDRTVEEEQSQAEDYHQKMTLTHVKVNEHLETTHVTQRDNDEMSVRTTSTVTSRKFKLPKIELKKFSGELKEWLGWWAQFSKIHEDDSLDPTDKFQYLFQSTVEGSKAREVVDAYPQSAENYPKVIEKLKDRFGKEKLLKQVYVRELLKLVNTADKGTEGVSTLFYTLDSHIRPLSSLGVTKEQSADFLYPMVESCLPEELLIVWQRHPNYLKNGSKEDPQMNELSFLLEFLRVEVENEEQRKLTKTEGTTSTKKSQLRKKMEQRQEDIPTAAGLFEGKEKCVFCSKTNHQSHECFKAATMSIEDKKQKLKEAHGCFICFKIKPKCNGAKFCKMKIRCSICTKKHFHFMCPDLPHLKQNRLPVKSDESSANQVSTEISAVNSGIQCGGEVILKTVLVRVLGTFGKSTVARLLFDEGSQSSYVTSYVVNLIQNQPTGQESVRTVMIDGSVSSATHQNKHYVTLKNVVGNYQVHVPVRERPAIGGILPRAKIEKWTQVLKKNSIVIPDHDGVPIGRHEVDILIGGDLRESLMTGKRVQLDTSMFAVKSVFVWMLCGPVVKGEVSATETIIQSYLTAEISQLWNLDVLGIRDPAEKSSTEERDRQVKVDFQSKVKREVDGRYVVKLPFVNEEVKDYLPTNETVSMKRLQNCTSKLEKQCDFDAYDCVFQAWKNEKIIEVPTDKVNDGHYLPHRPVFKDSVTTPVRPVFDASCHVSKKPSLNQCLGKGPNWLELIPSVLLRFRQKRIGITADIRKAFQMISVAEEDRKFQRFFWWKSNGGKKELQPYQHCRVVFGMTCSPFTLAAILELHLDQVKGQQKKTVEVLRRSLYVDNCVTSVESEDEYLEFKNKAIEILAEAKMDLRQWETSIQSNAEEDVTKVLGLKWDKVKDTLYCQILSVSISGSITKRKVLSVVSQIFEPIGYSSPALLQPKLMLQEAWAQKIGWDEEWSVENRDLFLRWYNEISSLEAIQIPRMAFGLGLKATDDVQFHVFSDASQVAFAGAVFVRVQQESTVSVQLLAGKSRVATIRNKKVTIPRLELLGCLVAARLFKSTEAALDVEQIDTYFWTDSSTVLTWIQREENWGTFVGNRVQEIVRLTKNTNWRHIPGQFNPADLPSRGCSPKSLLTSKWWEGPDWLKQPKSCWPNFEVVVQEDLVNAEKKKTTLVATEVAMATLRFSSYIKNVRVMAWVRRFVNNSKMTKGNRMESPLLSKKEVQAGEVILLQAIQKQHFGDPVDLKSVKKNLILETLEDGLLHVQSRLLEKSDTETFRRPILLPRVNPLVHQLIEYIHRSNNHAGTQIVLGLLRERYWITQGRKTVGNVIQKCVICKRFKQQSFRPEQAPLPKDRVEAVFAFQKTGVDLAGPLKLKGGEKVWIVLYTCAVYRGIHLDIVTSLSTEAILMSLERCINLVGRSDRIFSDQGTNFVGARNLLRLLDIKKLEKECQLKEIRWTLNPPAAPWWGGWWERLVCSTKQLLRRMLGTAKLDLEELMTCLAAVEGTLNDRPLTTLTEDGEDLIPLTPRMFIRDLPVGEFPEGVEIGANHLRGAYQKLQVLKEALRARFRKEYLAMLVQRGTEKPTPEPKVRDVVLVGMDNKKRFQWPLGRIVELMPGRDGKIRVAKVKVACKPNDRKDFTTNIWTRPIQRLYPLELGSTEQGVEEIPTNVIDEVKKGQVVKKIIKEVVKENEEETQVKTRFGCVSRSRFATVLGTFRLISFI